MEIDNEDTRRDLALGIWERAIYWFTLGHVDIWVNDSVNITASVDTDLSGWRK